MFLCIEGGYRLKEMCCASELVPLIKVDSQKLACRIAQSVRHLLAVAPPTHTQTHMVPQRCS